MIINPTAPRTGRGPRPRGATLIIGMILVLLLSVVALTSLKGVKTDERMAGNQQDRYLAFQAAEAALREGEILLGQPALPAMAAANGIYRYDQSNLPTPFAFTTANAREYPRDLGTVARRPLYIVEQLEASPDQGTSMVIGTKYGSSWRSNYRITALGYGGSGLTRVVLQTTYRR